MDALTLDQIRVFLSVVDEGSFPKAAKSLQRAQSAVTYAIRKLEAEIGVPLFDRSAYRSVLTPPGRALLTRARRIAEEAGAFREQARGLASGLEPSYASCWTRFIRCLRYLMRFGLSPNNSRQSRRASTSRH